VLVVDDSAVQRAALIALLESDPALEVAGWAADGAEALPAIARLRPDVVTMDLHMPRMNGVEATRRIMQELPTPIVMVTASATGDDARTAFDALQAGVLAIVQKPAAVLAGPGAGDREAPRDARELVRTVKSMAQVKVLRRWAPERLQPAGGPPAAAPQRPASGAALRPVRAPEIVVVGASTGGPQALGVLLSLLPASFPLPVLVVQHIAVGFVAGMVGWLTSCCALPVHLAATGRPAGTAGIVVAPTGQHLTVRNRTLWLTDEPPVGGHRPSATALFQSAAREYGAAAVGVLLSGMGDDGAAGLRDLKRAGAVTVAQDEASSVVFGMPAAAIQLGIVDHVLPPAAIAAMLVQLAARAETAGARV
jgi:two-component system chemotaxis response regulator CheB